MPEPAAISPAFAREASRLLLEGQMHQALEMCVAGVRQFPGYATGHLILARCYESAGRFSEAAAEYRKVLAILPDVSVVQVALRNAETREQQQYQQFAREQESKLSDKKIISVEEFVAGREESAIEYLAKRLQDVKRIQPKPVISEGDASAEDVRSVKFVTTTMAEIYVGQGEFAEAIEAYRELARQHPEEQEKYRRRIAEIEELLAIQQQERALKPPST